MNLTKGSNSFTLEVKFAFGIVSYNPDSSVKWLLISIDELESTSGTNCELSQHLTVRCWLSSHPDSDDIEKSVELVFFNDGGNKHYILFAQVRPVRGRQESMDGERIHILLQLLIRIQEFGVDKLIILNRRFLQICSSKANSVFESLSLENVKMVQVSEYYPWIMNADHESNNAQRLYAFLASFSSGNEEI